MKKLVFALSLAVFVLFGVSSIQQALAETSSIEFLVLDKDPDNKKKELKKKTTDKKSETTVSTTTAVEKGKRSCKDTKSTCKASTSCCPKSTTSCCKPKGGPDKK